jgi:hypothetical protein
LTEDDEPRAAEGDGAERRRDVLDRRAISLEDLVGAEPGRFTDRLGLDLRESPPDEVGVADEEERRGRAARRSAVASPASASRRAQKSSTIAL